MIWLLATLASLLVPVQGLAREVGVFYFPGWNSGSRYWKDIQGLPESRSPNRPWPEREPLLGYYAEEDPRVAETHIEWATAHGITFFAYDWYWYNDRPSREHALLAHLAAKNRASLKFSILWANHGEVPPNSIEEFDRMVDYWSSRYFSQAEYLRVNGRPVVFIYSYLNLEDRAGRFGQSVRSLLSRANRAMQARGAPEIFFVATTNRRPGQAEEEIVARHGFHAYTAWNYVAALDKSRRADYESMIDTYIAFYRAAAQAPGTVAYIVPASPGWDDRPWMGAQSLVRENSSPERFKIMLRAAKRLLDERPPHIMDMLLIEAWNEFAEGAYIEPTRQWGFGYLEAIREVFGPGRSPER